MDSNLEDIKDQGPQFELNKHISYFTKCLNCLPYQYTTGDTNRMTLAYFILSSLDLMGALEEINEQDKNSYIEWVYAQQVVPVEGNELSIQYCGFRGSSFTGVEYEARSEGKEQRISYNQAHLTMTYTALLILILLKDDFNRVNKKAIINSLKYLQQQDGSFVPVYSSTESDLRFTYCAIVISYLLNDFSGISINKALEYIRNSQTYEYAISQGPNLESHGGSTYCGIASLTLLKKLDILKDKNLTLKWCLNRQASGFHGRLNKLDDTCYSFWIGASIHMLNGAHFINDKFNAHFLYSTQSNFGGFSKYPGGYPDLMHSYMGLTGLSLMGLNNLKKLNPAINLSEVALEHWKLNILPNLK